MQCLIDSDILVYECGFSCESAWKKEHPNSTDPPPFDNCAKVIDERISNICAVTESTEPPILYLTGKTNFRNEIAKRVPYKQRASHKPFHFKNITAYIKAKYDVRLVEGLEADDLMSIEQTRRPNETIICTRDKDLRAVPGWHYGWELGNQPQYGPKIVGERGEIRLSLDRKSIKGEGLLFFYSQCLTGDKVDSIPGLEGCGVVGAFNILDGCTDTTDAFKRVLEAYRKVYGPNAEVELLEQGRLLWMTRRLHPDGSPVLWELPIEE